VIAGRLRTNTDDRYFTDTYQAMPANGCTALFGNMLDHKNIDIELGVPYEAVRARIKYRHLVYTGAIDAYFNRCLGPLPYRSIRFEHEHLPDVSQLQPVATINYPNDHAYTRVSEFKHLTGQQHPGTSIVREYPLWWTQSGGDPHYPIPSVESERLYKQYERMASQLSDVTFVGRLAQYKYYNMDQVVGAALSAVKPWVAAAT
jgi:UDP-galactopyranose mutase